MVEKKALTENTVIDLSEYKQDEEREESPVIIGQRYLNIFHQIHIFNKAQKKEFNRSLLEMPSRIRKIMPTLPGGRMLLEYIEEMGEKEKTDSLALQKAKQQEAAFQFQNFSSLSLGSKGIQADIGVDFTQNLADSLAQAFKQNLPLEDISSVLNKSIDASSKSIQKLTKLQEQNIELLSQLKPENTPTMLPIYGIPNKKGNIVIDKTVASKKILCPTHLLSKPDIYAVSLCSHRLGSLLPTKSVLFVDPNEIVSAGDIALYYISETETTPVSVRENENGQLYGLQLNPDEQISLPSKETSRLHRVVFISL